MGKFAETAGVVAGVLVAILLATVVGSAFGALSGLIVNIFFHDTMQEAMAAVGMAPIPLWKFGAFMGFVGGFIRSTLNQSNG